MCRSSALAVFLDSDLFHGLLLNFGVPKRFPWLSNPGVRLHVGHQHSQFWPILARFMDYYSPFWGPKAIFKVVELQGAHTCRSSTLAVFVDADPFHGLLLSFGFPKRFLLLSNHGVLLLASHQRSPFWPILVRFPDYYSPFSRPEVISKTNEPRGVFTCRSSTLVVLADSGPFHGLLLTVLGSWSDIHY